MTTATRGWRGVGRFVGALLLAPMTVALSGCSESPGDETANDGGGIDAAMDTRTSDASTSDGSTLDGSTLDASTADRAVDAVPPDDGSHPGEDAAADENGSRDVTSVDRADTGAVSPDGDGSTCTVGPVWNTDSASFRLVSVPTMIMKPPPGVECSTSSFTYAFDLAQNTLSYRGCIGSRNVDRVARLDGAVTSQIVDRLQGMRSTCSPDCHWWFSLKTLTVRDKAGCTEGSWDDDKCSPPSLPPYVPAADMDDLVALLDGIMAAACEPDGSSSDAGPCNPDRDGGANACPGSPPPDAAGDAPGDGATGSADVDASLIDASDGEDAGCVVRPVGKDFVGFNLGLLATADGACARSSVTFDVSLQAKTLTQYDCVDGAYVHRRIDLIDSQIDALLAPFASMQTSCETHCGPGGIDGDLRLYDCRGQFTSLTSHSYTNCDQPPTSPLIDPAALLALEQLMRSIIAESCATPADAAGAGVCMPRCRQSTD